MFCLRAHSRSSKSSYKIAKEGLLVSAKKLSQLFATHNSVYLGQKIKVLSPETYNDFGTSIKQVNFLKNPPKQCTIFILTY